MNSDGVLVEIAIDGAGWSARAEHRMVPGSSCVVYYGEVDDPFATLRGLVPAGPSEIVCEPKKFVSRGPGTDGWLGRFRNWLRWRVD